MTGPPVRIHRPMVNLIQNAPRTVRDVFTADVLARWARKAVNDEELSTRLEVVTALGDFNEKQCGFHFD